MSKVLRKIIEIDEKLCNGCGQCVLACQEGAIAIVKGKAKLISESLCDGLGACIGECPTGALKIIEREAEEFDEKAVKFSPLACGCPSHQLKEFNASEKKVEDFSISSALTHWPVQIRLVPSSASFLEGANLLVCADCVGIAYPKLHIDLLPDKKIMIGCPKFDPMELYIEKFTEIFETRKLRGIEIAIMEVPCCKGLLHVLLEARKSANIEIPIKVYTIGVKGEILREEIV